MSGYYVTAIDGNQTALLVGPLQSHEAALARVDDARRIAQTVNSRASWWFYGTSRDRGPTRLPNGKLNDWFGVSPA